MRQRPVRINVHPDFKTALEHMAVDMNKSVMKVTELLSTDQEDQLRNKLKPWKRRTDYGFFRQ